MCRGSHKYTLILHVPPAGYLEYPAPTWPKVIKHLKNLFIGTRHPRLDRFRLNRTYKLGTRNTVRVERECI